MIHSTLSSQFVGTGLLRASAIAALIVGSMMVAAPPATADQKMIPEMKKIGYIPQKILEGSCARSGGTWGEDAEVYGCGTDDSAVVCDKAEKSCVGCTDGCKGDGKDKNSKRMQAQIGLFRSGRTAPLAGGLLQGNNGLGTHGPAPTGAIAPNSLTGPPAQGPTIK